ncbi:tail fiber protein [Bradyrhizobium sp. WSM 1738]|uniref:phage tail protein n=1 Tax=Bradyrhizobium hereditatis TaxID=2821405 RepID=UPI001CE3961B|nr:tail fiber protein [Bradyrhizobium hereditatis]MCA6117873.1 tail fiber protein [Bradyrhizobium hereditatis]
MTLYKWSQTAASNATADPSINWQEGQAPSSVNDSARAMMASIAKHRDDIAGAIVTGGTASAYTVTSYEAFESLARLNGQIVAFTPHVTNGGTVTLNVDSLGPRPLRSAPATELLAGTLIQGTPYLALYNNSDAAFYLHGFYGNPYNVPLAAGLDYWGPTTPNSAFAFPMGQAISRTTYSALFGIIGTTYGPGDGSSTFNLPDKTGRVSAMKEPSASRLTSTYFGGSSTSLGATGGSDSHTLTVAQLASHAHPNTLSDPGHTHSGTVGGVNISVTSNVGATVMQPGSSVGSSTTGITITNANAGSGNAHNNVQPTIICNYVIRIV